ncbi:MAG TPA: hydroxysqualene dehydroxylase HpnE [Bryobacteraceae bacterium]
MSPNPSVAIVGGGLAGLSTALALGSIGYPVTVYEARPFLGGRATSYSVNTAEENLTIDNCQHVLLRCCVNLIDFYQRLEVIERIDFWREFYWIEPGGRVSILKRGRFRAPFHLAESFAKIRFLAIADKISIARALLAARKEYGKRTDLERITMLDWLREKKQTASAIERFWRQVLVSAINEDLDRMAAVHGLQVFALGFLQKVDSYEMGVPAVPLGELYSEKAWARYVCVKLAPRTPIERLRVEKGRIEGLESKGELLKADAYVFAVPFERIPALAPELGLDFSSFTHSPITGIHLWFDRQVTKLPHATLLDRTIQWMFNKDEGRYLQLVISASRSLAEMPRGEVVDLALKELKEFFPAVADAKLERSHVVKEMRATFSAAPGLEGKRPRTATDFTNLFLAGDWTRSGWPATMEGAVRSGYLAAEAVAKSFGNPQRFLV